MSRVEVTHFTLTVGSETVPDMRFYRNGMDIRPERRDIDGWGTSVELAGVVQLLDAVAAGDMDLAAVRRALVQVSDGLEHDALAEPNWDGSPSNVTPELLRCFGDCPACESKAAEFRALLEQADARRARLREPERYAVAVTGSSVHRLECRMVQQSVESSTSFRGEDPEEQFRSELRAFTHGAGVSGLPYLALTADGYDRWRAERTGPQGGLRYRLCKICDPPVPLA